jgi:c-di-GMP-binding flagellar brake protein YcgR
MSSRQHPRFPVRLAAEIDLDGRTIAASTQNVSVGGAALVLDAPIPDGRELRLTLVLTQDGIEDPDEEPLETKAKVAWTKRQDAKVIAGLQFHVLAGPQRARLERFLAMLVD